MSCIRQKFLVIVETEKGYLYWNTYIDMIDAMNYADYIREAQQNTTDRAKCYSLIDINGTKITTNFDLEKG